MITNLLNNKVIFNENGDFSLSGWQGYLDTLFVTPQDTDLVLISGVRLGSFLFDSKSVIYVEGDLTNEIGLEAYVMTQFELDNPSEFVDLFKVVISINKGLKGDWSYMQFIEEIAIHCDNACEFRDYLKIYIKWNAWAEAHNVGDPWGEDNPYSDYVCLNDFDFKKGLMMGE